MQFNVLRGFLVEEHATRPGKILLSLFQDTLMIKQNITVSNTKEGKIQKKKQNFNPAARFIQPKFRPVRLGKVRWTSFFENSSGWIEPIHRVLDRNFRKFWLNGSRPLS